MKAAFLFPGQGAQAVGMGKDLFAQSAAAKAVFEEADDALGEKLSQTIFEGPEDALKLTANTQPSILTVSVAAYRAMEEAGVPAPAFVAGHSLGEYSALVAAGALPFGDAVKAVRARGTFMQEAVPEGEGAMAAVLGLDPEAIREALSTVATSDELYVAVANYNGDGQTVIAGTAKGVEAAQGALKDKGAKRVMPLPVSAPFHCALMKPVQARLAEVLETIKVSDPTVPVVSNVEATPHQEGGRVKGLLVEQVVAPVRFTEMGQRLLDDGVDTFVEVGPGKTLIGILKRMDRSRTYLNVESPDLIAPVKDALSA
jgi:[acyl-carrier-protein] S-malonyltransferase